jgi:hypothetical protein
MPPGWRAVPMRTWGSLLAVMALALAGCSGSGSTAPKEADFVVTSSLPDVTEVGSADAAPAAPAPPKEGTRGHIAGFVVSETLHPVAGAQVKLPGLDLTQKSDRDGSFGFVDLRPGPYFLTVNATGHYPAKAEIVVKAGEFVRVKVVLTPVPPPTPYHRTETFNAFADLTQGPFVTWGITCNGCQTPLYLEGTPDTIVLEAYTDMANVGFRLFLDDGRCCSYIASGEFPNPMRVEVPRDRLPEGVTTLELRVYPESLVPQANVKFTFYATSFHNGEAPPGWSVVNGDR